MKSERWKTTEKYIPDNFSPDDEVVTSQSFRTDRWHVDSGDGTPICSAKNVRGWRTIELLAIVPRYDMCLDCKEKKGLN